MIVVLSAMEGGSVSGTLPTLVGDTAWDSLFFSGRFSGTVHRQLAALPKLGGLRLTGAFARTAVHNNIDRCSVFARVEFRFASRFEFKWDHPR